LVYAVAKKLTYAKHQKDFAYITIVINFNYIKKHVEDSNKGYSKERGGNLKWEKL